MNPLVLLPVLAAAVLHATWNAMLKTGADRFWWMTMFCVVDGLAAAVLIPFLPLPAAASWPYILGSAALHVVYQFLLLRTYAKGDFSQTYPIAFGGYGIIIWAMTVSPMGPVSALRETSVVFAAIIARVFMHERPPATRIIACVVVALGAAFLALG